MESKQYSCEWVGRTLEIVTGKLAQQATASVTVRYGDTVVLAAVVQAKEPKEGMDYFPLLVGYEERLYAAGIIKGSRWIKREGRPSDESVLAGRMIDRAIRPLFDQKNRQDVQITLTILSADSENDPEIVSLIAASATLAISNINWRGPIAGVKVGRVDGKFVFNPSVEQEKASDLDLTVAGMEDKIIMLEAGAKEIGEKEMLEAMKEALKEMKPALDLIKKMAKELKPDAVVETQNFASLPEMPADEQQALELAKNWITKNAAEYLFAKEIPTNKKQERQAQVTAIKEKAINYLVEQGVVYLLAKKAVETTHYEIIEAEVTRGIMERDERVDGRKLDEIRPLSSEVALLPRTHGSAVFQRGETQVLSTVTLGSPGDEQFLENLEGKSTKKYMHHYNFPPYSVGEVKPSFGPSRRDIGHGALAEKAIKPMLPTEEEFPYTVRVVSEVLGSNGSSSMGSTCGSSLALMDAGVPIKKAVAGIAMGLASAPDMKQWKIITDLQDLEDGEGGMDFKITGTREGITAIQLDTKTLGLPMELVKETLTRAKAGRLQILDVMASAIAQPRPELSPYAPRIISFKIDPERIGEVIGTGGKIINGIIKETAVTIDISDEGLVSICSTNAEQMERARKMIEDILHEFAPGEEYIGKVTRVMDFGVIVSLPGGNDGMVHVSEMAPYRVGSPSDLLKMGDEVTVRVKAVEENRISLTMKGIDANQKYWEGERGKQEGGFGGNDFDRGGRGGRPRDFDHRRNSNEHDRRPRR
ncbi:polyribonucleotide nucleotidyltransferase [Candidatus Falkowbacteria bacterium RIFOXYA2_FULL_47_9]|uniref:Polyribonucleotide nucleotidyltransferase n=1 Tax=Candidatus Falkowbacteria bacterium RIFOXYA2_FULL_47_9 TaxID=1797995 RepID=A0A1F5SNM2_9BACT|nr:MAG: polyribonucleotide nucleotidyltransferase [Candidatus Falkowbacteria bacterium RIFOXYA2_FULL_47_9]